MEVCDREQRVGGLEVVPSDRLERVVSIDQLGSYVLLLIGLRSPAG